MADGVCIVCGGPVRSISKHSICTRTEECRRRNWRIRSSYVRNRAGYILRAARRRAEASGAVFTLTKADLPEVPELCPILGIPLQVNSRTGPRLNSPSLDRKDPALGYVPGNIWWISHLANTMKSSADQETLERFARWVFAQMGLPLCQPCPDCSAKAGAPAGHVPADDECCDDCGQSLRVMRERQQQSAG